MHLNCIQYTDCFTASLIKIGDNLIQLDSLSAIQSLLVCVPHHPLTTQIICQVSHLYGFPGNKAAEVATKEVAVVRKLPCDRALASDICVYLY